MFDSLGDKLGNVFRELRGTARLSEENIQDAVRQVREDRQLIQYREPLAYRSIVKKY